MIFTNRTLTERNKLCNNTRFNANDRLFFLGKKNQVHLIKSIRSLFCLSRESFSTELTPTRAAPGLFREIEMLLENTCVNPTISGQKIAAVKVSI